MNRYQKSWGDLKSRWTQPEVRDEVVGYVREWSAKTEMPAVRLISRIGVGRSKFYDWRRRRSQANGHNDAVPRESWLTDQETEAVIKFHQENPSEGYRRLSYMMLDADVAGRIGDSP